MAPSNYLRSFKTSASKAVTPQTVPAPGKQQVKNNAGGYVFEIDLWSQLNRWLILGSAGGTYYASEQDITSQNIDAVMKCIKEDGLRTVSTIIEISQAGRAKSNDPALYALALCSAHGDLPTKEYANASLPKVARIGTHLFHYAEYANGARGWGKGLQHSISKWYNDRSDVALADQVIKYQQRDGWAHRDLLRKCKPHPSSPTKNEIFHWITKGWDNVGVEPHSDPALVKIWAFERAKATKSLKEVVSLISDYQLPRECVPTEWLNHPEVWTALLPHMKPEALIRNLAKMTSIGLLKPLSSATKLVKSKLSDAEVITGSRIHPITILIGSAVYRQGHGVLGSLSWTPVKSILDAINDAFYLSFGNVEKNGKRNLIGLDVSGSMGVPVSGCHALSSRGAVAAMALLTARTEDDFHIMAFSDGFMPLSIGKNDSIETALDKTDNLPFQMTDCALPMLWAKQHSVEVDVFQIYTDNDTFAGNIHPFQALRDYRQKMGIDAKLAVCATTASSFSIADPNDAGMMDFVGFDAGVPNILSQFVQGKI